MSNDLRQQVYNNLNLKETDELVEMFGKRTIELAWSDIAFDTLQEILQYRLGEVPPQGEPIFAYVENEADDEPTSICKEMKVIYLSFTNQEKYYG